jgi:hypothetical protein
MDGGETERNLTEKAGVVDTTEDVGDSVGGQTAKKNRNLKKQTILDDIGDE